MELVEYLSSNFVTRSRLLEQTGIDLESLVRLQELKCMPACSYRLNQQVSCTSPIAEFEATETTEFYAQGYCVWLETVAALGDEEGAFDEFATRYSRRVDFLLGNGFGDGGNKFTKGLHIHLLEEWNHFLNGTYGVCTRKGLPEEIATKEIAASTIATLISNQNLEEASLNDLQNAVDLMDSACSEFAPHERAESSRQRLIVVVREKYNLQTTPVP